MEALLAETDVELARTGLEAQLKLLEGFLSIDPNDRQLLLMAAQGFTGYAMMFLEDQDPARAALFYERARRYGCRLLARRNRLFLDTAANFDQFQACIGDLKYSDLPAAYWTAVAWAGRINLNRGSVKSIAESGRAAELMKWVLDRDPHYYYSGPLWFMGVYYATLPPLLGGGPEKAKPYFERALKADGDRFLWGKLLYAQNYALSILNRDLFDRLLTEVVEGAANGPKDLGLLNTVAARRAVLLRDQAEELF